MTDYSDASLLLVAHGSSRYPDAAEALQRVAVGRLLEEWERDYPGRVESLFGALTQVSPSQLADPALFDFGGLEARRVAAGTVPGDAAVDERDLEPRAGLYAYDPPPHLAPPLADEDEVQPTGLARG